MDPLISAEQDAQGRGYITSDNEHLEDIGIGSEEEEEQEKPNRELPSIPVVDESSEEPVLERPTKVCFFSIVLLYCLTE